MEERRLFAGDVADIVRLIDRHPTAGYRSVLSVPGSLKVIDRNFQQTHLSVPVRAGQTYQFSLRLNKSTAPVPEAGGIRVSDPRIKDDQGNPVEDGALVKGRRNRLLYRTTQDGNVIVEVGRPIGSTQTFSVHRFKTTVQDRTAVPLASGRLGGSISGPGDADRFAFDADAATQFVFQPLPRSVKDTTLRILTADGKQVAFSETGYMPDVGGFSGNPTLTWVAPTPGRYFLEVGGHSAGAYKLRVRVNTDDQADRPQAAEVPGLITGRLDYEGDSDVHTFQGVAGRSYRVNSLTGARFHIEGPAGRVTACKKSRCPLSVESANFVAKASGTYRLTVAYGPDSLVPSHDYRIAVREARFDEPRPDDVPVISPGTTTGTIQSAGDVHWYRFDAIATTRQYAFEIVGRGDHPLDDGGVAIFTADGQNTNTFSDDILPTVAWVPTTSGTYYLAVAGYAAGDYEIRASVYEDDEAGASRPLALDGQTQGAFDYLVDTDTFTLPVEAGVAYDLELDAAEGARLWVEALSGHGRLGDTRSTFIASETRTLTIRVANNGTSAGTPGPYTIRARTLSDDQSSPVTLTPGQTVAGRIDHRADIDYFHFQAQAGKRYELVTTFKGDAFNAAGFFSVYTEAGDFVANLRDDRDIVFRADVAGLHELRVNSSVQEQGTFSVKLIEL